MKEWNISSYELPMIDGTLRKGAILQIDDGFGEIAPLPGRSKETLQQAIEQTSSYLKEEVTGPLFPSVAFALDSALHLKTPPPPVPLSALFSGTVDEIITQAALSKSFASAKVKISQLNRQDAIALLHQLKQQFRLRVDANQCFSFQQALHFFSHFSYDDFDYIEEPTYETELLPHFTHPFALDETLTENIELKAMPHLKAVVIKPTMLGGIEACTALTQHNLPLVFSSSFESPLGLSKIVALAVHLNQCTQPFGLDTLRYFKELDHGIPLPLFG